MSNAYRRDSVRRPSLRLELTTHSTATPDERPADSPDQSAGPPDSMRAVIAAVNREARRSSCGLRTSSTATAPPTRNVRLLRIAPSTRRLDAAGLRLAPARLLERASAAAATSSVRSHLAAGPSNTGDKLRSGARVQPRRRGHEAAFPCRATMPPKASSASSPCSAARPLRSSTRRPRAQPDVTTRTRSQRRQSLPLLGRARCASSCHGPRPTARPGLRSCRTPRRRGGQLDGAMRM